MATNWCCVFGNESAGRMAWGAARRNRKINYSLWCGCRVMFGQKHDERVVKAFMVVNRADVIGLTYGLNMLIASKTNYNINWEISDPIPFWQKISLGEDESAFNFPLSAALSPMERRCEEENIMR
jgi:hypothetical protein